MSKTQTNKPYKGVGFAVISYQIMEKTYMEGKRLNKTPEQISEDIKNAYPWEHREGRRYNKWLDVRRDFFEKHGLPISQRRTSLKNLAAKAKQL